jgi:hypothetical protein
MHRCTPLTVRQRRANGIAELLILKSAGRRRLLIPGCACQQFSALASPGPA